MSGVKTGRPADKPNPFGVWLEGRTRKVTPKTFNQKIVGSQFGLDAFDGVILKPVPIDTDFPIVLDDRVLVQINIVRVGKALLKDQVRNGFPKTALRCIPAIFQTIFLPQTWSGDVKHKTSAGLERAPHVGKQLGTLFR